MKKLLLVLLALVLCCSVASAEISLSAQKVEARSLDLNNQANTFILQDSATRLYRVVDADMNVLSGDYDRIDAREGMYKVYNSNNFVGLLDGQGAQVIPVEYDDVKVISSRWTVGIRLVESTSENYDYETWLSDAKKFFLISTVDVFFLGEKKATLSRQEWFDGTAYGDYLCVQNRDKQRSFYNKDFVRTPLESVSYGEYDTDYNRGRVIHQGSGQEAFAESCTLTPEEVEQSTWIKKDILLDLQGNALADLSAYYSSSIDSESGMIRLRNKQGKHGLADAAGKELIPCLYDSIDYNLVNASKLGYIYAVKDGKGGFINLKTGAETGFEFIESAGRQRSAYIVVEDPREGTILISAAVGELSARYQEADIPYNTSSPFATVKNTDGTIQVIGMTGENILPDNPEIKNTYDVEYSNDGSLILVQDIDRIYHIYKVSGSYEVAEKTPETEEPASADDGTWTCENGHEGNTGKFCSECGAPKPVVEEPAEDDGTWTCENGHEGNTGKFCSECGAPKPAAE